MIAALISTIIAFTILAAAVFVVYVIAGGKLWGDE